jgi:hypothetical protein
MIFSLPLDGRGWGEGAMATDLVAVCKDLTRSASFQGDDGQFSGSLGRRPVNVKPSPWGEGFG